MYEYVKVGTEWLDFHKLTLPTVLKINYEKQSPKTGTYRDPRNFANRSFNEGIMIALLATFIQTFWVR